MLEVQRTKIQRPLLLPQKPAFKKAEAEVIILREVNENLIRQILIMEERLSEKMRYNRQDLLDSIRSQQEFLFCCIKGTKILGYAVAIPHNNAVAEIGEQDPLMKNDLSNLKYYVDRINLKHSGMFDKLVKGFFKKLIERGYTKLSSHVATSNSLNKFVLIKLRRIITEDRKDVYLSKFSSEPFEYMEFDLSKFVY